MAQQEPQSAPTGGFSLRRRLLSLPTLISFAVAAALLILLVTRFNIDVGAVWSTVRHADPWLFLLAILIHYTTFIFRGWRWRILLKNVQRPEEHAPSILGAAVYVLIGWFANSVTWFRLGDAYRAYAYSDDSKASFSRTLGTMVGERVQDTAMVFLLLMAAWVAFWATTGRQVSSWFVIVAAVMMLLLMALLLAMLLFRARLMARLPKRLQGVYDRFHQGTLGSFHGLPMLALLGLLGWMAEVGRLFFVVRALGIPLDLPVVLFATLGNAILTLVPLTPGGLGIVESGLSGLLLLLVPALGRGEAVSIALMDRSISFLSVIVFGALAFIGREIVRRRVRNARPAPTAAPHGG